MTANVMAILQDVDKCMRCNGCVVACKRTWKMKYETIGVMKVAYDQRLAIKSQKSGDMGPFVRFSCWHCQSPPCAAACPFKAIVKRDNGAVDVDYSLCDPANCTAYNAAGQYPCQWACGYGGYPKVQIGSDLYATAKAYKCTMCYGKAGADILDASGNAIAMNPTRATQTEIDAVAEKKHEPSCVGSCPAKAMKWDTRAALVAYLDDPANGYVDANGYPNYIGEGSMFWASRTTVIVPPKADPLVEDHISPIASGLFGKGLGSSMLLPTLVVGGLVALSARRASNEEAPALKGGEL